ncbi:MAG TPA: hypothetical protein VJK54_03785, partial [Chthoniobacterales bacterium]|nr:hypothetical protein [Chthoniobacterales bacterium]
KLMMNPSTLEEGAEAIGEALGVLGKRAVSAKGPAVEVASILSISSSQVLRLRGGGPKKSQPTGRLKSTGDTSEEEDGDADPDLESEETSPKSGEVNKYLKNEIINNIYTECLAEVAKLTQNGRATTENISKETDEWAAAEKAALHSKGQAERRLGKALRKTEEARLLAEEAKRSAKEAARVLLQGSAAEQALITATVNYEKARAAYTAADYESKRLVGLLAEAQLETADDVLHAISVRNTGQQAAAEAELTEAKEAEMAAYQAIERVKADVEAKKDLLSSAEATLNNAKRMVNGMSPGSPMTAAQRHAKKEIEFDQKIAEEALAKAKKAELVANIAKSKVYEKNFERELTAYHEAEEAWMETIAGYKAALVKAHEANLDDEELVAALASAEVHQATWRADSRWVKARQADQAVASGLSLDQLRVAAEAWAHTAKGYQMALEKATRAHLKCEELTASLHHAMSAQERVVAAQVEFERQLREKVRAKAEAEKKEADRLAQEKAAAKVKAETQAAKELSDAIDVAGVAWDQAVELTRQVDVAKASADRTKTENSYKEVNRFAQNASAAWVKATETKRVVLSKTTEINKKTSLNDKIQTAISHKAQYDRIALEALANAQEIAKKEAACLTKEKAEAQSAKELSDLIVTASVAWDQASEIARNADTAKASADSTKTERAYSELYRLSQNAVTAWVQAAETKKNLLSKVPEADKASLNTKIQTALSKKTQYEQQAINAKTMAEKEVANNKEAAAERETKEKVEKAFNNANRTKTEAAWVTAKNLAHTAYYDAIGKNDSYHFFSKKEEVADAKIKFLKANIPLNAVLVAAKRFFATPQYIVDRRVDISVYYRPCDQEQNFDRAYKDLEDATKIFRKYIEDGSNYRNLDISVFISTYFSDGSLCQAIEAAIKAASSAGSAIHSLKYSRYGISSRDGNWNTKGRKQREKVINWTTYVHQAAEKAKAACDSAVGTIWEEEVQNLSAFVMEAAHAADLAADQARSFAEAEAKANGQCHIM